MEQRTDQALIDEARDGSRTAFESLIRRHERLVYHVCFSYTHDQDDAMDVVQNVFLKVYSRLDTYRGPGAFRPWLLRIAHHQGLNWLRDHRKYRDEVELTADNMPRCSPAQETELVEVERRERMRGELDRLNDKQRLAVGLRYYDQLSIREIAAVLECREGVVKNLLFRSLQKLRQRLVLSWSEDHP